MNLAQELEQFIDSKGFKHFRGAEFTPYWDRKRGGVSNSVPPRDLWPSILLTLRVLDELRERLNAPIRLLSTYRSPDYILPSLALGAVGVATGAIPFGPEVDYLADKNIAYWFLALAAIAIASWSFIVRWLLNQLESQRMVNADVTNKLIAYMEGDHAKMIVVTEKVLLVMDKVLDRLETRNAPVRKSEL